MTTEHRTLSVTFRLARPLSDEVVDNLIDCATGLLPVEVGYHETCSLGFLSVDAPPTGEDPVAQALDIAAALTECGAEIVDVDDDFVDTTEISERALVSHEAARKWTKEPDFPTPAALLSGGARLWDWASVNDWLRANKPTRSDGRIYLTRLQRSQFAVTRAGQHAGAHAHRLRASATRWSIQVALKQLNLLISSGGFAGQASPLSGPLDSRTSRSVVEAADQWLRRTESPPTARRASPHRRLAS